MGVSLYMEKMICFFMHKDYMACGKGKEKYILKWIRK
jgi:hypothetical protein